MRMLGLKRYPRSPVLPHETCQMSGNSGSNTHDGTWITATFIRGTSGTYPMYIAHDMFGSKTIRNQNQPNYEQKNMVPSTRSVSRMTRRVGGRVLEKGEKRRRRKHCGVPMSRSSSSHECYETVRRQY